MNRLEQKYREKVSPSLNKSFEYRSAMEIPKITKIVINTTTGEAVKNPKIVNTAMDEIAQITGQKPVVARAKKALANFKLREGMPLGVNVTLRQERMWSFLTRLIHVALPRTRDFQGISPDSFDGRGNYTLGLREQLIFPEIDYDKIDKIRGMEVSIVTTAKTDEEGRRLLAMLGMPFRDS